VLKAVLTTFVAIVSPLWGLIFWTVNICDYIREELKDKNIQFAIFAGVIITLALVLKIDIVRISDTLIGVGVASFIFVQLYKSLGFNRAFTAFAGFELIYGFARKYIFQEKLIAGMNLTKDELLKNPEVIKAYPNWETDFAKVSDFYIDNLVILWVLPMVSALIFGLLLAKKHPIMKFQVTAFKLPSFMVYAIILSLGLTIFKETRFIGMPLVWTNILLLAVQGFPIVLGWFIKSTYNRTLLRIINYIVMILTFHFMFIMSAFVGLLDIWFNLKKGIKNENNIN